MRLTPWETDRLLVFAAAELARRRRAAGLALNHPEAVAVIADAMLEAARAGGSYAEVEQAGLGALGPTDVLPGVRELLDEVRLEVAMADGTRLVALVDPLGRGSPPSTDGPGAIRSDRDAVDPMAGRERRRVEVRNTSSRVVRVSSHHPFEAVNARLEFDREAARGFRLDLPAGASTAWQPGETRVVVLVRARPER